MLKESRLFASLSNREAGVINGHSIPSVLSDASITRFIPLAFPLLHKWLIARVYHVKVHNQDCERCFSLLDRRTSGGMRDATMASKLAVGAAVDKGMLESASQEGYVLARRQQQGASQQTQMASWRHS